MNQNPHRGARLWARLRFLFTLTALELRFVVCAAKGAEFDGDPNGGRTGDEINKIEDWERRKIRARVIVALCAGEVPGLSVHPRRGLRLRGAYVVGLVDLSQAQLSQCPLAFHTCRFEEPVLMQQATTADVAFTSCSLPGLAGAQLTSSGSLALTKTHLSLLSLTGAQFRHFVGLFGAHLVSPGEGEVAPLLANNLHAADVFLQNNTHVEGEVSLLNAQLGGTLDCRGARLSNPGGDALSADRLNATGVFLRGAEVKGAVRLLGARLSGNLDCDDAHLSNKPGEKALYADGLHAADVFLRRTQVEGEVSLLGARLSGNLDCDDAHLSNSGGYALSAESLRAADVFLRDATVKGEVRLLYAQIGGELDCRGAHLSNIGGIALFADDLHAAQVSLTSLTDHFTHVEGEVRLLNAQIRSQLYCDDVRLSNPGGDALSADGLTAASVLLRGAEVKGAVRLLNAQIRGQLYCDDARLNNPGGDALSAWRCQIGGTLYFRLATKAVGKVDLAYAQVGALNDKLASWPETFNLVGCSYRALEGKNRDPSQRLKWWLSGNEPFSPDVYSQLAEVYRRSGEEGYARKVAIEREKKRTMQPDLSPWVRGWRHFFDFTAAYGYKPWRAVWGLLLFFVIGSFFFALPPAQNVMVPAPHIIKGPKDAADCHEDYPCFSPPVYTLDTLLPIVDLHQESNWEPASERPGGRGYEILTWGLIVVGWILTTAVVASIGSLWRRE